MKCFLFFICVGGLISSCYFPMTSEGTYPLDPSDISIRDCPDGWHWIDENYLCFKGSLSNITNGQFKTTFNNKKPVPGTTWTMQVTSTGGDTGVGLDIVEQLMPYREDLTVVVDGYCLSSCANYLFTVGKRKVISGIVGYHGNITAYLSKPDHEELIKREIDKKLPEAKKQKVLRETIDKLKKDQKREKRYLKSIGIKQSLFDQTQKDDKGLGAGEFNFLCLREGEFGQFGISFVQVVSDFIPKEVGGRKVKDLEIPLCGYLPN